MQVECTLNNSEHIDKDGIREFLADLSYPLYFLDFETLQQPIPQYDGQKPYQQITFQYSLHIKKDEKSPYEHKEFLAPSDGKDPRRALAEQLCKDIPMNVCTLAYNKTFECGRIKELAELYPDLSAHLRNIREHIKDLLDPFRDGYYYVPAMHGSFSIKSVLPALFPDEDSLNYHNLDERCQNGGNAMTLFPRIQFMEPEEAAASREALLRYCELDTWAMVKVWEKLKEVVDSKYFKIMSNEVKELVKPSKAILSFVSTLHNQKEFESKDDLNNFINPRISAIVETYFGSPNDVKVNIDSYPLVLIELPIDYYEVCETFGWRWLQALRNLFVSDSVNISMIF